MIVQEMDVMVLLEMGALTTIHIEPHLTNISITILDHHLSSWLIILQHW